MTDLELLRQIEAVLPKYLSPVDQAELWEEIRKFPDNENFYLPIGTLEEDLLQGDGWNGLLAVNVELMERKSVTGLLVSNSCDIDVNNTGATPAKILFSPIIPLVRLIDQYRALKKSEEQLRSFLTTVRRQEKTNIFFLPAAPYGPTEESIVMLDDLHQQPLDQFSAAERTNLFRLNQFGFWTLLIKLSIHFSRFNEGVARVPSRVS